jgi:hypothetical protein
MPSRRAKRSTSLDRCPRRGSHGHAAGKVPPGDELAPALMGAEGRYTTGGAPVPRQSRPPGLACALEMLPGGGYCRSCGRLGFETLAAPIIIGVLDPCWAAWAGQPGWAGVQAVRPLPGPPGLFSRAQNSLFYHFFYF